MHKKYIVPIILVSLFIISMRLYYLHDTKKTQELLEELNKEYPSLDINSKIHGIVTDIHHPPKKFKNGPRHAFITLDGSIKRRVNSGDELTKGLMLGEILDIGDYFVKENGASTFAIFKITNKDTVKYTFELRGDLGYPLSHK
jgi:hypothetical protein